MDWFYNIQITIILFEISLYFVLNKIWHSTWRTIQFQTLMKFSDHVSFVPFTNHFCNWTSEPFYLSTYFIRYNKWINNIKKKKCKKLFKGNGKNWNDILFFKQSNRKYKNRTNISFPPIYFLLHNNYNLSHRFLSISHSSHVQAGIRYPHRFRLSIDLYIFFFLYFIILDDLLPYVTNFIYTSLFISCSSDSLSFHVTRTQRTNSFPFLLIPVYQTSLLRKTPRVTATFHYFGSRNNFDPPNNPINIISGTERW